MYRLLPLAAAALCLVACGKKSASPEAAASPAAAASSAITAQMPAGKDAMSYAKKLLDTKVENWEPISGDGASFKYNEMTFDGTGHWAANATLKAGMEEIDCTESGTWIMDEVADSSDATMTWKVLQTNCSVREKGKEIRVQMLLPSSGKYKINFR